MVGPCLLGVNCSRTASIELYHFWFPIGRILIHTLLARLNHRLGVMGCFDARIIDIGFQRTTRTRILEKALQSDVENYPAVYTRRIAVPASAPEFSIYLILQVQEKLHSYRVQYVQSFTADDLTVPCRPCYDNILMDFISFEIFNIRAQACNFKFSELLKFSLKYDIDIYNIFKPCKKIKINTYIQIQ